MLVLLSFGLVLVATVLLVLGLLVGEGLTLIYVSIGLSALAAVVLIVAVKVSKPKEAVSTAGPSPMPMRTPTRQMATVGAPSDRAGEPGASEPEHRFTPAPDAPSGTSAEPPDAGEWLAADQDWDEPGAAWTPTAGDGDDELELDFPIADYDELTTDEIMPLLPQLYPEEYDVVEERERAGQARPEILFALAYLRASEEAPQPSPDADEASYGEEVDYLEDEADFEDDEEPFEEEAEEPFEEDDEAFLEDEEPAVEAEPVFADAEPVYADEEPVAATTWADEDEGDWEVADEPEPAAAVFPIEDYDELTVAEIVSVLGELASEELADVRAHEASGPNQRTIINNIDRRLGVPIAPVRARAATGATSVKQSTRKAAATKKTAARATPARRAAAAPAKKAPSKKAAAAPRAATKKTAATGRRTTAPTTKTAVRKTAATKIPARKIPAKKAPARKSAAPARKAGAAKKTTKRAR
ncbi:hypothetical protein BH18ACT4_BH18ACT4_07710 [soil metagenome]